MNHKLLPSKWDGFITHFKNESKTFKEILKKAEEDKERINIDYSKVSKRSFSTIHGINRKHLFEYSKEVNETIISKTNLNKIKKPKKNYEIEYEIRPSKQYNWPIRKNNAIRTFSPTRLLDYPDIKRKKDIFVISGKSITDSSIL